MPVVLSQDVPAVKILEMFGVKDAGRLKRATITFEPNDIVYIDTVRAVEVNDIEELEMEFKKFKLVPIE